jgi:gliding motility-associated-like protein
MRKFYKILLSVVALIIFTFNLSAQQCSQIYVTPTGSSSAGAGTRANPASLPYAIGIATGPSNRIWMAAGTYVTPTEIQIPSNTTIEGGFDPITWVKSNATPTVIHRTNQIVLVAANGTAIFAGLNATNFRLQDLTMDMDIPNGVAATAYGIYLNGCSNYNIVRCNVTAADGTPGIAGTPGVAGTPGQPGANGNNGGLEPGTNGGPGGAGGGGNNGGDGAHSSHHGGAGPGGSAGLGPCGGAGGSSGSGPSCNLGCSFGSPNCNSATPGTNGTDGCAGTVGVAGATGPLGNITIPGYFVPGAAGTAGTAGTAGSGGGGGGGGGGRQNSGSDDVGGSGGGGGGGGGGGTGGTGGTGGGGSFAVFLFANGAGGNIVDCSLNAGVGGAGGLGGGGGLGASGASGGIGGGPGCGNTAGGNGGRGGDGGAGGNGGPGAQGLSAALSQTAGTPVTQSNITSVPGNPPVINVSNYGCTNAEVVFTTPVSGAWNFGAGASPATGNGAGPIAVTYSTTGRKSITLGGTVFADFVDIFSNQSVSNTITHVNSPAVTGCPDTFRTTLTGSLYEWDFGPAGDPLTASGATAQTVPVKFTAPGTYTISVWVTTPCCGRIKDSVVVTVQPNTINVTMSHSTDSVCYGTPITYTATPAGYQSYNFYVNGVVVQSTTGNTFQATGLNPGDSVKVLAFDGVCYSNPSAVHHPFIKPIPAPVTITSSDPNDTICGGDLVTFTALPTGYDNYAFYNGGSQQQSSASNTWATTQLGQGNVVYCIVTQNGCTSSYNSTIATFVKPTPSVSITVPSQTICQGDAVTVTASPSGLDYYDFTVNAGSVQNTAANTYSTTTFNNGDVVGVTTALNGCVSQPSGTITITVNPVPVVTLSSSSANDSICQGVSVTFTATPAGYGTYNFSNNGTQVQSGASNTYTTNLLAPGNSITVQAINLNCPSAVSNAIVTTVSPAPAVNAGADQAACIDAPATTLTGFTPATGGVWSGNGVDAAGTFTPATAGAGNQSLVYAYTDVNSGCTGYDSIVFTVNALPVVVAPQPADICVGQSAQLSATGGTTYVWSPAADLSNANIANPVATPAATTLYSVTVTDANSCSNTASLTVTVNPNPTAGFAVTEVCAGAPNVFTNTSAPASGNTYLWNFGDGNTETTDNPAHTFSGAGVFNVTLVATLANCSDTATGTATAHPTPVAGFNAFPLTSYNDNSTPITFTNTSTNSDQWTWDFGDQTGSAEASPAHVYTQPGTYTVSLLAANQYGCSDSITRTDYVSIFERPVVFIPNVFSPNGDGQNEILLVYANGVKYLDWKIFNRWGEKVFESNNPNQGWDGNYQGKPSPVGVYTYHLDIVFGDNSSRGMKGSVTLIK